MLTRAVVFDLFGTLVDIIPDEDFSIQAREIADILGIPSEEFASYWLKTGYMRDSNAFASVDESIRYTARLTGFDPEENRVKAAVNLRLDFYRKRLKERNDVIETFSQLKKTGISIGLISNCSLPAAILWPTTDMAYWVDSPIFSCKEGLLKPDPRIYQLSCEKLGVLPTDCIYVADGLHQELESASILGMKAVLIRAPYDNLIDSARIDPYDWRGLRISSVKELLSLLY